MTDLSARNPTVNATHVVVSRTLHWVLASRYIFISGIRLNKYTYICKTLITLLLEYFTLCNLKLLKIHLVTRRLPKAKVDRGYRVG